MKLYNKSIIIIIGILFALLLKSTTNLSYITDNNNKSLGYSDSFTLDKDYLKISAFSGKIHIDNNWTIAKAAGICTGNGIYAEPYVIDDLVIDVGGLGSCILIENSDAYFKIENCTLYNAGGYPNAGIQLNNVTRGKLVINNCTSSYYGTCGIYINDNCYNNTISGNTVNDNYYGLYLYYCDHNTISGNTANDNSRGIKLIASNNNTILGNTANNNTKFGIFLYYCNNNTILGNTANNNYNSGIYLSYCDYNTISGNTANNNYFGIYLFYCDHNTISGNTLIGNDGCIVEEYCEVNIFENNDCGKVDGIAFEIIILISIISGGMIIGIATLLLIRRKRKRME